MKIESKQICINCNKEFISNKPLKFCSKECRWEKRKCNDQIYYIVKPCLQCNIDFKSKKKEDKKYCSYKCAGHAKTNTHTEILNCIVCNLQFIKRKKQKKKICSDNCRIIWSDKNKKDRLEKTKKAIKLKYGTDNLFLLPEFQKKLKESRNNITPEQKSINLNKQITTLKRNTLIKNINKIKDLLINNNEITLITDLNLFNGFKKTKTTIESLDFKCNYCNTNFKSTILAFNKVPKCPKCFPSNKYPSTENYVTELLDEHKIYYEKNIKNLISPFEIDIYIPDKKIAIELNGNYYHSEISGGKNKNYHINKTKKCNELGITLIHIFEDELINKIEIVKSRILAKLGIFKRKIFARKCFIKNLNRTDTINFFEENHIQGYTNDSIRFGLYFEDELVSALSFSKFRKIYKSNNIENQWELIRFSNKLNTAVLGGFGKLLNQFIKKHSPNKIITFADIRWSGLNIKNIVYDKYFNYMSQSPPNFWFLKNSNMKDRRYHRFQFRKQVLLKKYPEYKNSKITGFEIMERLGYDRIWDCGSLKYEWFKK